MGNSNFIMAIEKGATIPNTKMGLIPWAPELDSGEVCGVPTSFETHKEWKGKKIVVVSIPGAYTPICHQQHIPPLVKRADEVKARAWMPSTLLRRTPLTSCQRG